MRAQRHEAVCVSVGPGIAPALLPAARCIASGKVSSHQSLIIRHRYTASNSCCGENRFRILREMRLDKSGNMCRYE